ncbi:MAG: hypothetical protein E7241_06845 [Lachnospiraceae bacterium]|jgi:hypothetical protein|nr:hypothetical protein [Lachnospiraceae bacterium]
MWKKIALFAGGALFGSAGITILSSKDAKKAYTHCTAAVLRGKDCVMETYTTLRENCSDIYSDAIDINNKRYEEEEAEELALAKAIVEEHESQDKSE